MSERMVLQALLYRGASLAKTSGDAGFIVLGSWVRRTIDRMSNEAILDETFIDLLFVPNAENQPLVIDATLLPGVRRELQRRIGLRLISLDPLGSSAPDGRSTWVRVMRYNLDQLVEGLGQ